MARRKRQNKTAGKRIVLSSSRACRKRERPSKTRVVSEGCDPPIFIPNPAACTPGSAALLRKAQVAEKVEVQEALPPAGILGAEPLSLMPQHFPREPAKRCFQAMAANQGFFENPAACTSISQMKNRRAAALRYHLPKKPWGICNQRRARFSSGITVPQGRKHGPIE